MEKDYKNVLVPTSCRVRDYSTVRLYKFGKSAGELAGYVLSFPKGLIGEIENSPRTNGKDCDTLFVDAKKKLRFSKGGNVVHIEAADFFKIAEKEVMTQDTVAGKEEDSRVVMPPKAAERTAYKRIYIPQGLRGKTYDDVQSYKLDDRFGDLSGYYFSVSKVMISEKRGRNDELCDVFSARKNYNFTLKNGANIVKMPFDEFRDLINSRTQLKVVDGKPYFEGVNSNLEEDIFVNKELDTQIFYNEEMKEYMLLANDDVDVSDNGELRISLSGAKKLQDALKRGEQIYFDTVADAKLHLYGADKPLPPKFAAEDIAEIDKQYSEMVIAADGSDEEYIPTKEEFAKTFMRLKNWSKYQSYKNDKAYEKSTPYALRDKQIFVGWKFEYYDSEGKPLPKPAKVPYNPNSGTRASSTNMRTWSNFDTVIAAVDKYNFDGIGVMLGKSKVIALDLDHCIDSEGKLNDMARDVIDTVDSYTEFSPSGEGVHIFAFASIPESKKLAEIEAYNEKRFVTLTGHVCEKMRTMKSSEITQPGIDKVWEKYIAPNIVQSQDIKHIDYSGISQEIVFEDSKILEKIAKSERTGPKFERLRQGLPPYEWDDKNKCYLDTINGCWYRPDGSVDQSDIDSAFAKVLVYFNATPEQIDRIYRASPIARPKWDEMKGNMTYGERIIANAYNVTTKRYEKTGRRSNAQAPKANTIKAEKLLENEDVNE